MAVVRRPSLLAVGLLTLAMAGTPGRLGLAEAQLASAPSTPAAHVWVSTPDGTHRMADWGTVAFHRGGSSRLTITVDPSLRYQQMDGFGASITDSSASVLYSLDQATREATMSDLFVGNRISLLRQPIGSSDFVDGPHYTYDDMPPGQSDFALEHFSIDHDMLQILPLLRQALALNPKLKVIASPWSPPAWMKTTDSLIGGRLIDDDRIYAAYANYLVKFVQAYEAEGVPIYGLTIQNEPQNRNPSGYPGTDIPVAQAAQVIDRLGPALAAAGLDTSIFGYDHNWSEHPNDIASTPPGEDPETEYPSKLLDSSAARWLTGTAYHCYSGDQTRMTQLHRAYPDKGIWFTECSGSHGPNDPPEQYFSDTLKWHARNLTLGVTRNWARSMVTWNLALRPDGGPHNGGCDTCTGVVTVHDDGTVIRNAEYYTIGHLSRFVRPGAWRVASSSFGTTGWNGMVMDTAFVNPDGSTALVVHNEHDNPRSFAIAVGDRSFDYTLPGGALATFTLGGSKALDNRLTLVDPTATSVTSNVGDAAVAADDDAATAWSTSEPQRAGDWLQVDLGSLRRIRQVVLDAGPATYGWESTGEASPNAPASYLLEVSADGEHWTAVRTAHGTGQLTTMRTPHNPIRFVRCTLTQDDSRPWAAAEVRVYR